MKKEAKIFFAMLLAVNISSIICFYVGKSERREEHPEISWTVSKVKEAANEYFDHFYQAGFNDALESIALVNLEFTELKNDPKTFGELADICRERKGIAKDR